MARQLRLLDQARVAAPCPANWDEMKGDDRTRHCSLCRLNVYNLSDMTEDEAEELLRNRQGRLCVRYYQRSDGKIMTKDCPKGLRALRQRAVKRFALAASFVLTALGCGDQGDKVKKAYGLDVFDKNPPVMVGKLPVMGTPLPPSTSPSGKKSAPIPSTKGRKPELMMGDIAFDPKK